ncbi:hypothetical protein FOIG_00548 [Fusarium odoratissimum NRRL 54006]|uniref:Uncharacterized protein n=2 Tax=Fusarium oxysporum species complex TaxID=171631 RepID=X0KAH1_FUSO5|nr:uncharacterized protein FOIG_00548 [Fusarium odoratissimum NRRL 54006]EXM10453.1 hypothetical protein FOIG_00548 [Fusarium odoratissimum NRRL 54006]TXC03825.1 hypothetical protein FocTR4_00001607 [Fusarium oxysporum f. sp. cubense]
MMVYFFSYDVYIYMSYSGSNRITCHQRRHNIFPHEISMSTAQCNYIRSDRQPQTTWCSLPPPPSFLMCMVASPFHPDKVQAVVYQHSLRHHATMDPLETRKGVLDQSGPALRVRHANFARLFQYMAL